MKGTILCAMYWLLSGICFGQERPDLRSDNKMKSGMDFLVDSAVVPFFTEHRRGLSIGICSKGRIYFFNYDNRVGSGEKLPTSNTLYEIGSITKTFAGYLLAKAALDKKLNLDDDIRDYLDEPYPNLAFAGAPIRLYQLLNHSSGLPFDFINRKPFENLSEDERVLKLVGIENSYPTKQILKDLHHVQLDTIPGKNLSYSNVAAQLLGLILERIYKKSVSELVSAFITGPLKMKNTMFALNPAVNTRKAKGYSTTGTEMPHFTSGLAGGLYSCTRDLLKYGRLQLDETNKIISLTHQPTWGQIQYYAMGLNWQMQQKEPEPKRIWQSGSTAGFTSLLTIYPERDTVIVLLANEHDENSEGDLSKIAAKIAAGMGDHDLSQDRF